MGNGHRPAVYQPRPGPAGEPGRGDHAEPALGTGRRHRGQPQPTAEQVATTTLVW